MTEVDTYIYILLLLDLVESNLVLRLFILIDVLFIYSDFGMNKFTNCFEGMHTYYCEEYIS